MMYFGQWIKLDWKRPSDSPEDLCEFAGTRPNYYYQGKESGTVYRLVSDTFGTYQWSMLDQRTVTRTL